jgi:tetratricopeptide (TPR) repeat protein
MVRGTVRQNMDSFKGPVEIEVESEGGHQNKTTITMSGTSADFDLPTDGQPLSVYVDPNNRYMRTSDVIKVAVIVRRGIEHMHREEYSEAEEQFREALKLSPRSSWAWYNRGLLYIQQRNWNQATDAFSQALGGDLEPNWIEVWSYIYRGNAYDAQGMRERAVAEYDKARDLGNDYNGAQKAVEKYKAQAYKPVHVESS